MRVKESVLLVEPRTECHPLPEFPSFKKLTLSDKESIEEFTKQYPPYSDFNFVSMWMWDVEEAMMASQLNGNLVIHFTDYLTGAPFYSFLGNNNVNETTQALLDFSREKNISPLLKLLPEDSLQGLDKQLFLVSETRADFDYVYDLAEIACMEGRRFIKKRNQVATFLRDYPEAVARPLNLRDISIKSRVLEIFTEWLRLKVESENDFESHEKAAVERLFLAVGTSNLVGVGVFVDEQLVAFLISELVGAGYAVAHASKMDRSFTGVNSFLMKKNAELLLEHGAVMFNYEQDLGFEKLRDAKMRFRPRHFLTKYQVTLNPRCIS